MNKEHGVYPVVKDDDGFRFLACPVCNNTYLSRFSKPVNYCSNCGQRILWSNK